MVADSTNSGNVYNDGTEHLINLARNLPIGNCQFDATKGQVMTNEDWFPELGAHVNGERVYGAVRQSTMGWSAEPDRAVNANVDTQWGQGSCTHTDNVAGNPAWWQVDLGGVATIDHVNLWHRTDCCQDRLEGAELYVSQTADYTQGPPSVCDPLSDHTQAPEVAACDGKVGRFLTVVHRARGNPSGGGQDVSHGRYLTICETEVWGTLQNPQRSWQLATTEVIRNTPPPPPTPAGERNLLLAIPTGNCQFEQCVGTQQRPGTCGQMTDNVGGGSISGINGVRRCGAARSSTVGWGGEPDRAVDKSTDSDFAMSSCTHTDAGDVAAGQNLNAASHGPAWWQVMPCSYTHAALHMMCVYTVLRA